MREIIQKIKTWWFFYKMFAWWYKSPWIFMADERSYKNTKTGRILTGEPLDKKLSYFEQAFFGLNDYERDKILNNL